jgi:hypothetical protein
MKLENEFVVPVPCGEAWDVLMNVERIACACRATFEGAPRSRDPRVGEPTA